MIQTPNPLNAVELAATVDKGITLKNHRFSVAPMMDWTDKHCRYLHRLISKHTVLYTEMVTTGALIHGDTKRFLAYNPEEHPVVLQLGGGDPSELALCAKMAEDYGYDEVNLNVGCPSDRVQNNMIGACLMGHPDRVADCIDQMQQAVDIPVTIKHRLGIDELDSQEYLLEFVRKVRDTGCKTFIIHARKAILQGLSPKENRDIPPLQYERVYDVKQAFPDLDVWINGGIRTLDETQQHLQHVDGVMVGREAYQNPFLLSEVDALLYSDSSSIKSRLDIAHAFEPYVAEQLAKGIPLYAVVKHMLGLFHGQRGGKQFRRHISENGHKQGAGLDVYRQALELVSS
ncbi:MULTISPECIES: tRNA dihydrouridine(20/20a) synthase DusA [Nitrincola]|uniref:tRNA-dihydrouridine(20/20a) synthase n=1 Tax=Nitrincola nitratireducens TaxID=1229521 RepID=W9VKQ0_9GAMM|nr:MULTISPECIES: tRNA dihydrouridine(20/20a) synthase DusA [Nitrincola]EXJ11115.1 putative tRNA-dihydrouridine synthase [Nitrincola nitratireducens]